MAGKREQLETLNMWGQKLTREEGLTNTDKDNIHKDLALINERFNKVKIIACDNLNVITDHLLIKYLSIFAYSKKQYK